MFRMFTGTESLHGHSPLPPQSQVPPWPTIRLQMQPVQSEVPDSAQIAQTQEDVPCVHQDLPMPLLRGVVHLRDCGIKWENFFFGHTNFEFQVTTHERIHTGIIKFECKVCDFKCNRFLNMEEHRKDEHGYLCSICQGKVSEWSDLKNHMLIEHGGYLSSEFNSGQMKPIVSQRWAFGIFTKFSIKIALIVVYFAIRSIASVNASAKTSFLIYDQSISKKPFQQRTLEGLNPQGCSCWIISWWWWEKSSSVVNCLHFLISQ